MQGHTRRAARCKPGAAASGRCKLKTMLRLSFDLIVSELMRVLTSLGFSEARARQSATLFAETQLDGVASHGLNRFPRFVGQVRAGVVRVDAEPTRVASFGPWEQWDGNLGPGNLNATAATSRAIALAREHGLGLVALAPHESLDARRHVRLAGGARGLRLHRLDQHDAEHAAVGRGVVEAGEQPAHRRAAARPRARGPRHRDVAVLVRQDGAPAASRRAAAVPGRLRREWKAHDRPGRDPGARGARCRLATGRAPASRWCSTCWLPCCQAARRRTRSGSRRKSRACRRCSW